MIHIYTGEGKGKTTAALGLALRAVGAGKRVFIAQFCKGRPYSELFALKKIPEIRIEQFGRSCFIRKKPTNLDLSRAQEGLSKVKEAIRSKRYQVIILDEICIALYYKLVSLEDIITLCQNTPKSVELILTGRYAPSELIEQADLVSCIEEVKHYYQKGVKARRGIEF